MAMVPDPDLKGYVSKAFSTCMISASHSTTDLELDQGELSTVSTNRPLHAATPAHTPVAWHPHAENTEEPQQTKPNQTKPNIATPFHSALPHLTTHQSPTSHRGPTPPHHNHHTGLPTRTPPRSSPVSHPTNTTQDSSPGPSTPLLEEPTTSAMSRAAQTQRIRRRTDCYLLPFLSLLFLLNSLDRSNIGNAETAGFTRLAGLEPVDLNDSVALFFMLFVIFQPVGAALGKRVGAARWVGGVMVWKLYLT